MFNYAAVVGLPDQRHDELTSAKLAEGHRPHAPGASTGAVGQMQRSLARLKAEFSKNAPAFRVNTKLMELRPGARR